VNEPADLIVRRSDEQHAWIRQILRQASADSTSEVVAKLASAIEASIALYMNKHRTMDFAGIRTGVIQHCHSRLARWKVPATLRQVEAILLNPSGKIARHGK
jgi:acyl-CoA synthetase (AMP-forming)/AMP-acid ligase II